jgi:hypothetical protein
MRLETIFDFFASLKLAVVVLVLALVLVFWGTWAQVDMGLYKAQSEFFRSFLIYWTPKGSTLKIPIFPGGYSIGFVFLLNLLASQIKTFELTVKKFGLILAHVGVILLLIGQLATDMLAVESSMHLREGDTKSYTETERSVELAVVDATDAERDRVTAIPQDLLAHEREISDASLPFTVRINKYFRNSEMTERDPNSQLQPPATQGFGPQVNVREVAPETSMDKRDMPSVVVELVTPEGSLGTWIASLWIGEEQHVHYNNREFHISLRPQRTYNDYSLHLLNFTHEVYPGTDIPKDFSSRVQVKNQKTGEEREVRIYMNNPLRYQGDTYYQASFDTDDKGTVLQVVRNPGWLTPYAACGMVGFGLVWQFLAHLIPFLKRKVAL